MAAEIVAGLLAGSLALLAEAAHLLTDAVGVSVAVAAVTLARRPAPARRSYGNFRVEILAALVNGALLSVLGLVVVVEAVRRLSSPPTVTPGPMLVVGVVGLAANALSVALLRSGRHESLNVRGAYLEVLGDLLGSGAVVA